MGYGLYHQPFASVLSIRQECIYMHVGGWGCHFVHDSTRNSGILDRFWTPGPPCKFLYAAVPAKDSEIALEITHELMSLI
jgi:hypothetical protein